MGKFYLSIQCSNIVVFSLPGIKPGNEKEASDGGGGHTSDLRLLHSRMGIVTQFIKLLMGV
jgi:hypothetical protein